MSKTTVDQIQRAVRVDEENRFSLAGRILAQAEILREEGETGDASLLARLAEVVINWNASSRKQYPRNDRL